MELAKVALLWALRGAVGLTVAALVVVACLVWTTLYRLRKAQALRASSRTLREVDDLEISEHDMEADLTQAFAASASAALSSASRNQQRSPDSAPVGRSTR